jgi:tetratricopeptide (TPR) repeat protein
MVFMALTSTASLASGQELSPTSVQSKPAAGPRAVQKSAAKGEVSDADCRAYALRVVKAVSSGNVSALNSLIDWDALFNTMLKGIEISPQMRGNITVGLKSALNRETGLSGQIIKNSQQGGTFSFLRNRENHDRRVILFRLIQPLTTGGIVSYFEFVPGKSTDGEIRATDLFVLSSSEFFSETLRRSVLPLVADESRTFLDKLMTGERDFIRDLPKFIEVSQHINQGKMKEALGLIQKMHPETRKQKVVLLMRLRAAQQVDETDYAATIEEYRKLYPNDPGLDLLSIQYYTAKKNFAQALACVDRIETAVGGDPYLDVIRASINDLRGNHKEARRLARRAVVKEPTLVPAYLELLGVSLLEKNYDDTLSMLMEIDEKLYLRMNDLTKIPEYAEFVKSPQYKQWLRYLEQKSKPKTQPPATSAEYRPAAVKPAVSGS